MREWECQSERVRVSEWDREWECQRGIDREWDGERETHTHTQRERERCKDIFDQNLYQFKL